MGTSNRHGSITLRSGDAVFGITHNHRAAGCWPRDDRLFGKAQNRQNHVRSRMPLRASPIFFPLCLHGKGVCRKKMHSFSVLRPFCQTQRSKIRDGVRSLVRQTARRRPMSLAKYARCAAEISRSDSSAHTESISRHPPPYRLSSGSLRELGHKFAIRRRMLRISLTGSLAIPLGCRAAVADSSPPLFPEAYQFQPVVRAFMPSNSVTSLQLLTSPSLKFDGTLDLQREGRSRRRSA